MVSVSTFGSTGQEAPAIVIHADGACWVGGVGLGKLQPDEGVRVVDCVFNELGLVITTGEISSNSGPSIIRGCQFESRNIIVDGREDALTPSISHCTFRNAGGPLVYTSEDQIAEPQQRGRLLEG